MIKPIEYASGIELRGRKSFRLAMKYLRDKMLYLAFHKGREILTNIGNH